MRTLSALLVFIGFAFNAHASYEARLFVNGERTTKMYIGVPMDWRIEIWDLAANQKVQKFKSKNGKFMHLVILPQDLSQFTHVHPKLMGVAGDFYLGINQEDDDLDSVGTKSAVTKPGRYNVIVEVFPNVKTLVPVPVFIEFQIEVEGNPTTKPEVFDQVDSDCFFTTYLSDLGIKGVYGDRYRVRMHLKPLTGDGGTLVQLHFHIDDWNKDQQSYQKVANLQPLMQMEGHLFLARLNPQTRELAGYNHLHGMVHPGDGSQLHMSFYDRGEYLAKPTPAKMWLQFKHNNRARLASFNIEFGSHISHMCH